MRIDWEPWPPPRKNQLGRSVFEHLRRACGPSCHVEGERLTYECDLTRSEGCLKGFLLLCFVDSHGNAHSAHMQGTAWQRRDVATLRCGDWFPCPLTLFPFGNTNSVPLGGTVAPETGWGRHPSLTFVCAVSCAVAVAPNLYLSLLKEGCCFQINLLSFILTSCTSITNC